MFRDFYVQQVVWSVFSYGDALNGKCYLVYICRSRIVIACLLLLLLLSLLHLLLTLITVWVYRDDVDKISSAVLFPCSKNHALVGALQSATTQDYYGSGWVGPCVTRIFFFWK